MPLSRNICKDPSKCNRSVDVSGARGASEPKATRCKNWFKGREGGKEKEGSRLVQQEKAKLCTVLAEVAR